MKKIIFVFIFLKSLASIAQPITTTWNGSAWSNGAPTAIIEAIIEGVYNTAVNGAISAKKLTVNSGVLTVNSGNLTIENEVINNAGLTALVIENYANLIQGTATIVNTNLGAITVKRNSSLLKQLDYTFWSSPVASQNLLTYSPSTVLNRFYNYNKATNLYKAVPNPATTDFVVGNGYLIRMPDTADPINPTAYSGVFTGIPNNGDVPYTMTASAARFNFNLVGNPYPSPISMSQFVSDNIGKITGALYFWRKTNGINTTGGAYCTWNNGTFITNNNLQSYNPNGIIQTGQGFIVEASSSSETEIKFKNSQRVANNDGKFFKTSQVVVENNRIFLNATSLIGDFSQMAINYVDGATNGVDAFDAKYFNDGSLALNSVINNTDYVIQGRALPFDATDLVPLSFYTATAGNYMIAIDHVDGLFAGSQDIILKDNDTGIETDLKTGAYTFVALAGRTTSRFVLKYQKTTTTWNGSAWSNGAPTATIEAIIEGVYNTVTNGTISAKKLTLNSGVLTVNSGNLTVQNGVINNAGATAIVIENNANLIQVNNTANIGAITIKRNSSFLKRLDYTLWSSPVANQNLLAFSPATILTRFYTYNTSTNLYNILANPASIAFTAGNGYLIRMPNTDPTTDYDSGIASLNFLGVFTGVPNNGAFSVVLVDGLATGLRYNLVGNPYPSPITMSTFVTDNALNIESTLYFWRKTNGTGTAYCTWVDGPGTGTFTTNGNAQSVNPLGVIQTGQGFFVEAKSGATSLSFNNLQRVVNTIGQFFRTKQVAETNRVWLNATNTAGDFSQMAVTYTTAATQGIDAFDGKYFNDSAFALTSIINNSEYCIQGRALPFDPSDIVPLSFKTEKAGDYTIAIDHTDGLLAIQDIYLVDSNTGIETNLKETAYTFNATVGVENSRFSLKYQKTLKVDAPAFNENSITVSKNKGVLYVNSTVKTINNIKVFDMQGRLIAEQKQVKATSAVIKDLKAIQQVLIVKISCEDNIEFTKKVVN